jgi:hypothetical protein
VVKKDDSEHVSTMRQVEQHKYGNYEDFLYLIGVNDDMEHKPIIRRSEDQYKPVEVLKR